MQSKAVDLQKAFNSTKINIPYLSETKAFLKNHKDLSYAIPEFIKGDSSLIVMRFKNKKSENFITLINPTYLSVSGFILSEEKQLGVEGTYLVSRHPKIEVMFVSTPSGEAVKQTLVGKSALVFQQAYDALRGIKISDFGLRIDNLDEYQNGSEDDRQAIGCAYLDSLKELLTDIEQDPEVKKYEKAVDFTSEKIAVGVEADKIIEEARKNESKDAVSSDSSKSSDVIA